jgi:predicted nucleic acid-binding protein
MAIRVFLDANVILDFVLKRENYQSVKVLFELEEKNKIKLFMSNSILHIIAHWLTKYLGSAIAKTTMLKLLDHIKVVEGNHDSSVKALESKFNDIEDAIQYHIALHNKMDFIISLDQNFQKFTSNNLPILEPKLFSNGLSKS